MIDVICGYIHNYFTKRNGCAFGYYEGEITIEDGSIVTDVPFLVDGLYFRIVDSRFNDGVHKLPTSALMDETFDGEIWEMRPPKAFLDLVAEIEAWQDKYGGAVSGPYQSESFNGYSYSKASATDASGKSVPVTWQSTFGTRLDQWRKLS